MLAWNRQLASLEVLIAVRFRGAVASDLVRVRACSCAVGKGWAHMFIRTVCAVGLHILRNLSSLVCKALSDYLAGQEGHCGGVVLGGIWVVIGCCGPSGLLWTTNLEQEKGSHTFTVLNLCSLVPCFTEVPSEFRIETLERFSCSGLRGINEPKCLIMLELAYP
jgi:hypothetical protein